ncbi:acyl-CoA Delta(11) desaturase-like isoform X2 [Pseudomyrmex gracilis]|nr:acyl-CoA Delta(11) desaturase-like isoform X2 [Pseudomyrmex gracilis]XP_020286507.1 acyl-CoA Delta(11) desaturase-like isoform X2 [Pseudomyrmex gracilis]
MTEKNFHDEVCDTTNCKQKDVTEKTERKTDSFGILWFPTLYLVTLHIIGLYGLVTFNYFENLKTTLWILIMHNLGCIGVTAGAHRLWSHRSYRANLPLRIILAVIYSSAAQVSVFSWVRIHRMHHKYVDTDLDPHNSRRGFFYCHIGWSMKRFSREIVKELREIDMRETMEDPVVVFQKKYVWIMTPIFTFILPTLVPVYFWNETWSRAFVSQTIRALFVLHAMFSINSVAHMWGARPYNKNIWPTENMGVSLFMAGEGFHNYHHVFPWDYQASEFSWYVLNYSALFIDAFAKIGWAYNLKKPSPELVKEVTINKGDGSHTQWNEVPPIDD